MDDLIADIEDWLAGSDAASGTVELDQTVQGRLSRMDAMQGQAMAKASATRARQRLAGLRAAKKRLAENVFGDCVDCDQAIAWPRLHANPAVLRCVACAENAT